MEKEFFTLKALRPITKGVSIRGFSMVKGF